MEFEFENGAIMNQGASEHIKDRRGKHHRYAVTGAFAGLVDKEKTMQKLFGWFSQVCDSTNRKYGRMYWTSPSGTSRCDNHGRTQNRTQTESGPGRHTLNLYLKQWQIPLWK
jgi:hypothetical protein